jgi:hypothetical protein
MKGTEHEPVTKEEAIRRLRTAGYRDIATELEHWRDLNGNNLGWDGWIRKAYPIVVVVIWVRAV